MRVCRIVVAIGFIAALGVARGAAAAPFGFTTTLTGDIRPGSPDNLFVDFTVAGDTDQNFADITVDLDMAAFHPNAKLLDFYFNLVGNVDDYSFSQFSPSDWNLTGTNVNASGSGGASFMFEVSDQPGSPHQDVTNNVLLTFRVTKLTGDFFATDFTNGPVSCADAGCGQYGAHIGNLTPLNGVNSGFATTIVSNNRILVPEPASMLLLGVGLIGAARAVRRRRTHS